MFKRISGFCFLLFSGNGIGSFGRRRSFLVVTGFISMESDNKNPEQEKIIHLISKESLEILIPNHHAKLLHHLISYTMYMKVLAHCKILLSPTM